MLIFVSVHVIFPNCYTVIKLDMNQIFIYNYQLQSLTLSMCLCDGKKSNGSDPKRQQQVVALVFHPILLITTMVSYTYESMLLICLGLLFRFRLRFRFRDIFIVILLLRMNRLSHVVCKFLQFGQVLKVSSSLGTPCASF
jgi:hypothetical protein